MANQKKLFALVAVDNAEKMAAKLAAEFPDAHLPVASGQWFLVSDSSMTTTEVSHKLHITSDTGALAGDTPGPGIVVSIGNYYGRAPRDIWEWVTSKIGGNDGVAG